MSEIDLILIVKKCLSNVKNEKSKVSFNETFSVHQNFIPTTS